MERWQCPGRALPSVAHLESEKHLPHQQSPHLLCTYQPGLREAGTCYPINLVPLRSDRCPHCSLCCQPCACVSDQPPHPLLVPKAPRRSSCMSSPEVTGCLVSFLLEWWDFLMLHVHGRGLLLCPVQMWAVTQRLGFFFLAQRSLAWRGGGSRSLLWTRLSVLKRKVAWLRLGPALGQACGEGAGPGQLEPRR